ncbi:MAG: methyl-accepting chemotaxis protein [Desulfobacterales bacterium]|nr:methyl-accepting chemotaxis protein [Desulfobacterales bacterium]
MIQKKLRYKILLGALALVLTVSIAITSVVSFLVTRQNKDAVHLSLNKTLTVIRDSVSETETAFAASIQHMATANKLGADVKFLGEFKDGDLSLTGNSYANVGRAITNEGVVNGLFRVRVYGLDGRLVCFFEKSGAGDKPSFTMGFLHQGTYHFRSFREGDAYDQIEMSKGSNVNGAQVPGTYGRSIPTASTAGFTTAGGQIGLETLVPVYANVYNQETEQSEPRQFGFVAAVKQLDQGFVQRMGRIIDMEMNLFVGDRFSAGDLNRYETVDLADIPERAASGWEIAKQEFYFNDITLDDSRYFQGMIPLFKGADRIGCLLVLQSDAMVKANTRQMVLMISLVALGCVVLIVPLAWLAAGRVVNPLIRIVDKLKDIAEGEGDLTTRLEVTAKDEIGQVAQWFNTFIDKIHALISDVDKNADHLNRSSTTLAEVSQVMAEGAGETSDRSGSVSAASEEMSSSMNSVSAAMDQASANMGMVAAATEEMTNTISEISKNTVTAKQITDSVVEKTSEASVQVGELGASADEIGNVVGTITDISSQVNLLALNATIEAARAGEAGKGFAVVANEIKELASQTADASKEIKEKVGNIRQSTDLTVNQINEVSGVVNQVNEIVVMIASAVEEQAATTQNISENITQVTQGVDQVGENITQSSAVSAEIAGDIAKVSETAGQMTENSATVDTRSKELSGLSEQLTAIVKKFKI